LNGATTSRTGKATGTKKKKRELIKSNLLF